MRKALFFSHLSGRQTAHAILLTSLVATLVGCGYGNPFSMSEQPSPAFSGTVMGGSQIITGASIQAWAAGVSGYGSQATFLASTTSLNDGSFSFGTGAYTCPTNTSIPVYITATGGNPGNSSGNSNPKILLVAMLGSCSAAANAHVHMNEITTVAAAYAMSGFINPANFGLAAKTAAGDSIGTSYSATPTYAANNNNIVGLNNAVANAGVLANTTNGTSPGTTTNGTVDVAKVNTLANILASCVNSDPTGGATQCSTLFTDVSPSTGTAATNTFEAAYYLCQNPTNSASSPATVLGLASTLSPFQPTLAAAPTDWTVGVNYTATGMTAGQRLAIDPIGNVWVTSANSTSGGQVTEFGPTGSVLNTFTGSFGSPAVTLTSPTGIAIDRYTATSQGYSNVAVADSGTNSVFVFSEGTSNGAPAYLQTITGTATVPSDGGAEEPYAITFAGKVDPNFMYFTETNTNAVTGTQNAYFEKSTYSTTTKTYGAVASDHGAIAGPYAITVSTATNTVFVVGEYQALSSTTPSTSDSGAIRNFRNADLTGYVNQYANTLKADFPIGAVFDSNSNLWFSNAAYAYSGGTEYGPLTPQGPTNSFLSVSSVTQGSGSGGTQVADSLSTSPAATAGGAGGLNDASYLAIDGNNSLWVANLGGVTNGTTTTYGVSQFANNGSSTPATALSPGTTGYVHNMSAPNDIAIDSAGNVWVVNSGAVNYVTEIVGAATPTVTPIVYNIYYGTWGQRP